MSVSDPISAGITDDISKGVYERFFSSSGGGGTVTCAYPLDCSGAQASAFGFDGLLTMSGDNQQQGAYTIQSALVSSERWAAFPSGAPSSENITVPAAGVAVAVDIGALPDLSGEGASAIQVALWLEDSTSPGGAPSFGVTMASNSDGTFDIGSGVTPDNLTISIAKPKQLCLYVRQTESPAGGSQAGISVVYADDTTEDFGFYDTDATRSLIPILVVLENTGLSGGLAGETVNASYVTAASSINAPVPAGYQDPCGNTI